ncbi:MAG: DUF4831 family protein, partial [Bacteroidales bacterium]
MSIRFSFSLCFLLTISCHSLLFAKKKEVEVVIPPRLQVQKVNALAQIDSGSFLYALPRTIFRVNVVVERDEFFAGVYAVYAQKFLGISGVATKNQTKYEIKHIKIDTYNEPDIDELYM